MKTLQLQTVWTLQSLLDDTGRRRLTIACHLPQPVPRRRAALRRAGATKLAVMFPPEELFAFEPVVRTVSR
jgi:hypothetical protein